MDQDTNVHLRWNHHQTTLLSVFSSLLGNENLVDCTISAEGQYFKAHRVILSACSPYFELLFREHCEIHPVVVLPDVGFSILKALMDYMYSGEVKVPQNTLSAVLELAESLQIKGLPSVSEIQNDNRPEGRTEFSIPCDQHGIGKDICEPRFDSEVEPKGVSSLHNLENGSSEGIDTCQLAAPKLDKNISNSDYPVKTVQEAAMFQDILETEAFNMFGRSSVTKMLTTSNTCVSGTSLNSVSNFLGSSRLSGSSKVKTGEQRMLSENVISTHLTGEELRTSESVGVCGERPAADLLSQIKEEDPDDFNSTSIEEIILDDDTDERDNRDSGSGDDNSNSVGGLVRVIPEQSFSGQGFCNLEQYRDTYFVEPESILPKPFKCSNCGMSYSHISTLSKHLKYECGKKPQFKCPQCSAIFFHKYDLKVHFCSREQFRDAYSVEPASILPKPFKCSDCGRSYLHKYTLSRHLKYECGKKPQFNCPQCSANFFRKYDLKVHICSREQFRDAYSVQPASILPKPFKCSDCGRSYKYSQSLRRHLNYECGKERQFWYPRCPLRFFHKHDLKWHLREVHKPSNDL